MQLIIPIIVAIITQLLKTLNDLRRRQFSWRDLNSYGGFPSSHTAFVVSLFIIVGQSTSWTSIPAAIVFVFGLIVVRDALGIRRQLGLHARLLNQYSATIPSSSPAPHLDERLGHTPLEVLGGAVCGVVFTLLTLWFY